MILGLPFSTLVTLAAVLFVGGATSATAQPVDTLATRRPAVSSLSLSFGVAAPFDGKPRDHPVLTFSLDLLRSVGHGRAVVQLGGSAATVFDLFGPTDEFGEIHVAAGVRRSAGAVLVSGVAGPSLVLASRDDDRGDVRTRVLPGAYAAMRAALVVTPRIGFGAEVFAHANAALPVAGVRGVFAVGRLPGALVPNPPAARWGRRPRGP